jgi:hypothetical protein
MEDKQISKFFLKYNPTGKIDPGRPQKRWKD